MVLMVRYMVKGIRVGIWYRVYGYGKGLGYRIYGINGKVI